MLFYLIFSWLVLAGVARWRLPVLTAIFTVLFIASHAFAPESGLRYLLSHSIIFEFVLGVLAAELMSRRAATSKVFSAGSALLGCALLAVGGALVHSDADRWIVFGIPAFLIVLGFAAWSPKSSPRRLEQKSSRYQAANNCGQAFFSRKSLLRGCWPHYTHWVSALVYLGDASYTIYLLHSFTVLAFGVALKHKQLLSLQPDILILVLTAAAIGLTAASYRILEQPLNRWVSSRLLAAKPSAPARSRELHSTSPVSVDTAI